MASETFSPSGALHPDWSEAANWSGGEVPGTGVSAIIDGVDAWVDPQTALAADLTLAGGAALVGDDGGFSFAAGATLAALDSNALYADGAIVNAGTIIMQGGTLTVVVEAGANIAASYALAEPSFENEGGILIAGGLLAIDGTEFSNIGTVVVSDAGVLSVTGGWVDGGQGTLAPGGVVEIGGGGLASFSDGVVDQSFSFEGPGTISFGDPDDVSFVAIENFGNSDEILAPSLAAAKTLLGAGLTFNTALPPGETLAIVPAGTGAAIIAESEDGIPPCFVRGTRILTTAGYAPVEDLRPGDRVITASGAARPIRWVGWRSIDLAVHRRPNAVRPIRVTADAMEAGVPARDVRLSLDHALFLQGQLVPVKFLVNGVTILRETDCLAVTYFHVETDRHEILFAENLAAESYLDTGNRNVFENEFGSPFRSPVFGRGAQWDGAAFAPLCVSGPPLRAIRRDLFDRLKQRGFQHKTVKDVLLTAGGRQIIRRAGGPWLPCFQMPAMHDGMIAIRSGAFVPAEMAYDADDWRMLGVALRRIRLDDRIFEARDIARAGFHPRGLGDTGDWTDGNGIIGVPADTRLVELDILALPKAWTTAGK